MPEQRGVRLTPDQLSLKRATAAAIDAAGGPSKVARLAARVRRQQSYSDYALPNVLAFAPVDVAIEIEEVTIGAAGHPHITREMCRRAGGSFVPDPPIAGDCRDVHRRLAALAQEYADLSAKLLPRMADGKLCSRDVRDGQLIDEACELVTKAVELRRLLEAIEGGE